jgi:gluconolactonase
MQTILHRTPFLLFVLAVSTALPTCAQPSGETTLGFVERLDPRLDALVPPDAVIEVLAKGFEWAEGPLWVPEDGGFLLFSDVPQNIIYRYADGRATPWLEPSGYTGTEPRGGEPGSNGLALDPEGRLVLCQHGDRRIARLDAPWSAPEPHFTTLADRHEGHRFHSPNDLTFDASGNLYFTDPPYGLEGGPEGPGRELDFQGVYRLSPSGEVTLLTAELSRPNGIALSPDGATLYVANSDPERAVWRAYDLSPEGTLTNGRTFFDATPWVGDERPGLPDGLEVDPDGNLFATGPGGVLLFTPEGEHLGTLRLPQPAANCAFGDDGQSLYITADSHLLRIRLTPRGSSTGAP